MSNQPTDTSAAGRGGGEAECLRLFQNALLRAHDTKEERQHQYKSFLVALERISSPPAACDSKLHEAAVKLGEWVMSQVSWTSTESAYQQPTHYIPLPTVRQRGFDKALVDAYRAARAAGGEGERRDEADAWKADARLHAENAQHWMNRARAYYDEVETLRKNLRKLIGGA